MFEISNKIIWKKCCIFSFFLRYLHQYHIIRKRNSSRNGHPLLFIVTCCDSMYIIDSKSMKRSWPLILGSIVWFSSLLTYFTKEWAQILGMVLKFFSAQQFRWCCTVDLVKITSSTWTFLQSSTLTFIKKL